MDNKTDKNNRAKTRLLLTAIILAVMTVFALSGCAATPPDVTSDNTEAGSMNATHTPLAQNTDGNGTDVPTATLTTPDPTVVPTAEPTAEPVPVFLENEYNIGTKDATALAYIAALKAPEKEIMTAEEIAAANARMISQSGSLTDILDLPESIGGKDLEALITAPSIPALPLYDRDGADIDEAALGAILEQRNIAGIGGNVSVSAGIIVRRSDLKRLPTDKEFHSAKGSALDRIQDTELYIGMPVWILWRSTDDAFVFVQSYYYAGWIKAEDVAAAETKEEWLDFADPAEFAVITDERFYIDGEQADMGVKLPYTGIEPDGLSITAILPVRNADGSLGTQEIGLPVTSAHKGYLKYTYANFIAQAFKYIGTDYSWGGLGGGVDCSSYVASVLRPFGLYVPRDTKDQNGVIGTGADISGKSANDIRQLIAGLGADAPVAVYTNGHVRFYLGENDGVSMSIHAPGSNKKVTVASLDNFDALISVRVING